MGTAENKQLAAKFIKLFSAGAAEQSMAMVTDDFRYHVIGNLALSGTHDQATVKQMLGGMSAMFEQLTMEIVGETAEGERVAVEARSAGKTVTGKSYANAYHFLFKFRDGKIEDLTEYMDTKHVADTFG